MISVSVSLLKTQPCFWSSSFSSRKFSTMPLPITATVPATCGCALRSEGLPWVAQRVWPMPIEPASGTSRSAPSRFTSLPCARITRSLPSTTTAIPAES